MSDMQGTDLIDAFERGQPFGAGKEPGEQGSIEWLMERVGHQTGSMADCILTPTGKPVTGKARENYLLGLVTERLLNRPGDHWFSAAMLWGQEQEKPARMAYEARTHAFVMVPGFVKHPTIEWCGASSDGLIDDEGTIEAKCPANPRNHLRALLYGMPAEHKPQVQDGLWVQDRLWCDFISYHPDFPAPHNLYIQRIARDQAYIDALEAEVIKFLAEVASLQAKIAEKTA